MILFSTLIAQNIGNPILNYPNATGVSFFQGLLPALINLGFVAGSVFFIFNVIMGGIKWTSAGGDKGHLESARSQVTNAIIGLMILFSLYAVVSFMEYFFSVDLTLFDLQDLRVNAGP